MPIYEYQCDSCGEEFQALLKVGEAATSCPICHTADPTKKVSAGSFILKGGGWYKDHYGLKKANS